MALSLRGITLGGGKSSLRETLNSLGDALSGYFVRYRLALYLLSAAAVALGVALSWNWLTAAALFRVVAVLPCALMMFRLIPKPVCNDVGHGALLVAGHHRLDPGRSSTYQIFALLMPEGGRE